MNPAKALDAAEAGYWAEVDRIAAKARTELVIPFCNRKGWTFEAGMGVWSFRDKRGAIVPVDNDTTDAEGKRTYGARLWQALEARTSEGHSLGSLMEGYPKR